MAGKTPNEQLITNQGHSVHFFAGCNNKLAERVFGMLKHRKNRQPICPQYTKSSQEPEQVIDCAQMTSQVLQRSRVIPWITMRRIYPHLTQVN